MDFPAFALFLSAALLIALSPGPGILYVAARTLAGGRSEGITSTLGTGIGGLLLVAAGALGVSALVLASAEAFTILKIAGALYLVWLGLKTMRRPLEPGGAVVATGVRRALRDGVLVEAFNPKTAAFFLAFVPQFIDPASAPAWVQFCLLGSLSVLLNTAVDLAVVLAASRARAAVLGRTNLLRRLHQGAGLAIAGLGVSLLLARRPRGCPRRRTPPLSRRRQPRHRPGERRRHLRISGRRFFGERPQGAAVVADRMAEGRTHPRALGKRR